MHVIVSKDGAGYYLSRVFAYYNPGDHHPYYLIWNEDKTRLIRWEHFRYSLHQQAIIIDMNQNGWVVDEDRHGCVDFLTKDIVDDIVGREVQPEDILEKCRQLDVGYTYNETPEVKTDDDIETLYWATGEFHDGIIYKQELQEDNTLYLYFKGIWGCEVELWFWGDLEYDLSPRDPDNDNQYWYGATVIIDNGYIYFMDEDDLTLDYYDDPSFSHVKARHMKYHIIPTC